MKNVFDKWYKKYDAWYDKNKYAYLSELEALKKVIPKGKRGLEIGVGTGRFAWPLGTDMGIDPSREMIEIAAQRGVTVRWGTGEDLPFGNKSFDYVTIIITLSFVHSPLKVLKEAWRVLEDSGQIIIGIINKDSFLGEVYQAKKSVFYKSASLFTVCEITDLLKVLGFGHLSYYQTIFEIPEKMKTIQKPHKGFDRGGFVVIKAQKLT